VARRLEQGRSDVRSRQISCDLHDDGLRMGGCRSPALGLDRRRKRLSRQIPVTARRTKIMQDMTGWKVLTFQVGLGAALGYLKVPGDANAGEMKGRVSGWWGWWCTVCEACGLDRRETTRRTGRQAGVLDFHVLHGCSCEWGCELGYDCDCDCDCGCDCGGGSGLDGWGRRTTSSMALQMSYMETCSKVMACGLEGLLALSEHSLWISARNAAHGR
jgi:hypothetical protein